MRQGADTSTTNRDPAIPSACLFVLLALRALGLGGTTELLLPVLPLFAWGRVSLES